MPTTDEELKKLRKDVEDLREKVTAEEAKRVENERTLVNDIEAAQLLAEKARLEAQLAEAKKYTKVSVVKEGASSILDAAKDEQQRAAAALDAATAEPKKADDSGTEK